MLSIQPKTPEILVGKIKWNGPFPFGPTGVFGTSFEGGPLRPVWSFRSGGQKCPFPFGKIVVSSTALLYPAYKNNNQTRGGLGGGSVAEWLERWTCNSEAPSLSPTLTAC